jgi:hypothetical protein
MRRFADQAGLKMEQAERRRAQEETRELQAVTEALPRPRPRAGLAVVRREEGARRLRRHPPRAAEDGAG